LASFPFNEIELEDECDTNSQCCDSVLLFEFILILVSSPNLDPILKSTWISIPIKLEYEPPILDSHIPLLDNEYEFEFYDFDQTHELILTLKPKLDLNIIPSQYRFPFPSLLSPNHPFHKITFYYWTKI